MADNRLTSMIQHAIQYPSAHLDRFASFGPAFEMSSTDEDRAGDRADALAGDHMPELIRSEVELTDSERQRAFILAGRAIFTLAGSTTRYTFKVTRKDPEPGSTYTDPAYFVNLLTGPDNTADYTYIGMLDVASGRIKLTRRSSYRDDSGPVKAFNWTIARIWRGVEITPARIYHVGRCGRCGRALTVPSSIEMGIGPECAGKIE